jgi:hypothetical protein
MQMRDADASEDERVNGIEKSLVKRIDKSSNSEVLIRIATVRFE